MVSVESMLVMVRETRSMGLFAAFHFFHRMSDIGRTEHLKIARSGLHTFWC
jgi:hypothetical protein